MRIIGNNSSAGKKPTTPTIGTAVDGGTGTTVNVPFTASTYIGKDTITYTALSNPGSISATSSGSPINVTGLTSGTAYTFTITGNTNYGVASDLSSASNSVTPSVPGSWDWIATLSPTGAATATFSSIPSGYQTFRIIGSSDTVGESIGNTTINGFGADYAEIAYFGSANSNVSTAGTAANSSQFRRFASNSLGSTSILAPMFITYYNADTTISSKPMQITSGYSSTTNMNFTWANGINSGASAKITSIRLSTGNGSAGASNWLANTNFTLYGMKE